MERPGDYDMRWWLLYVKLADGYNMRFSLEEALKQSMEGRDIAEVQLYPSVFWVPDQHE